MRKILVSACLLGRKVRYDGGDKALLQANGVRVFAEGDIETLATLVD